jgi:hypothetical protein
MRFRYYCWFALGWFTFFTALHGISALIEGPGRVGPVAMVPIYAITAAFYSAILWIQMIAIARFHRPWFKISDSFVIPLLAGFVSCGLMIGLLFAIGGLALILSVGLPLLSLWIVSFVWNKFGHSTTESMA